LPGSHGLPGFSIINNMDIPKDIKQLNIVTDETPMTGLFDTQEDDQNSNI